MHIEAENTLPWSLTLKDGNYQETKVLVDCCKYKFFTPFGGEPHQISACKIFKGCGMDLAEEYKIESLPAQS